MRYEADFIERVRDANNIVDIIGQHTELKARGYQHMGLCPFPDHNEKSPSFSVSENKQLYHCFGCKKSGNIFTFLETYNGFSFVEALEYLARRAHIEMPKPQETNSPQRSGGTDKSRLQRVNKLAGVFYFQNLKKLPEDHKAKKYLKQRGLTAELVEEFRLGYASENWDDLHRALQSQSVPSALMQQLGLIRPNKKGGYFDLFRDRLMFPIFAVDGEVIGFGGRIIDQGQPKYINSVESDLFKKGQSFYGIHKTAPYIRSEDQVFVVEGYMDLLALYAAGIKNAVATLGTALTEKHVIALKKLTKNVVLLFDGDAAGQTAAERSLIHFLAHDLLPQIMVLPTGKDPDDFIKMVGQQEFRNYSKEAQDLFLHLLGQWMTDYSATPKDKINLIEKVSPYWAALQDPRLKQMYVEEVARVLLEEPRKVLNWLQTQKRPVSSALPTHMTPPAQRETRLGLEKVAQDELVLLGLSLKSSKFLDFFIKNQGLEILTHEGLQDLFQQVALDYGQEPENFDKLAHLVISRVENPEKIVNLINFSSDEETFDQDSELLKECFIRVKDRFLQRQASVLVAQMKNQPDDLKLERFVNIQNDRKALKELKNTPLGE